MLTKAEQFRLEETFIHGGNITEWPEHWISGGHYDRGLSYCRDCARKIVDADPTGELVLDGGWCTDGDGIPYCEECGRRLENTLTDYGCQGEVDHYLRYGFDPRYPGCCADMVTVTDSRGWEPWGGFTSAAAEEEAEYFKDLTKLCRQILRDYFWIMPDNDYRHMWE